MGIYAVFGNDDYCNGAEGRIAEELARAGVRFLRNESVRLDCGRGVLAIVGVEDLQEGRRVDLDAARAGLEIGDVEVLLCHNPQGAPLFARPSCALVLSGHAHGAQIDLPLLRNLGPPHHGPRLPFGKTTSITSRGLGVVALPLRLRARAEVVIVSLCAAGGARE